MVLCVVQSVDTNTPTRGDISPGQNHVGVARILTLQLGGLDLRACTAFLYELGGLKGCRNVGSYSGIHKTTLLDKEERLKV